MYGVGAVAAALVVPLLMGVSAELLSWRVPYGLLVLLLIGTFCWRASFHAGTEKIAGTKIDWGGTMLTFWLWFDHFGIDVGWSVWVAVG